MFGFSLYICNELILDTGNVEDSLPIYSAIAIRLAFGSQFCSLSITGVLLDAFSLIRSMMLVDLALLFVQY